jgi:outer membrane immunogenic protein
MRKVFRSWSFVVVSFFCTLPMFAGPEAISSGKEMKEVVAPVDEFSWTGFYAGARLGYGWHNDEIDALFLPANTFTIEPPTQDNDADGFVGGLELGYNRQIRRFVIGVETDFSGSTMSGDSVPTVNFAPSVAVGTEPIDLEIDWLGTVRARFGFVVCPRLLVYGTGGLAYVHSEQTAGIVNPATSYVNTRSATDLGWTAGGGAEYGVTRHWTVKVEFLHFDVGDHSMTAAAANGLPFTVKYDWDTIFNTVTVGANYKF